ncbi:MULTISPECIES: protein YqgG [Escherichia]|nr:MULTISPECIES: protein YqgG [Escherichia]
MNRCLLLNLSHCSGEDSFPALCISALHTCRCYTHLGASQDSRAGYSY